MQPQNIREIYFVLKIVLTLILKNMSLENLNLVELNAKEVRETDGGFIPIIIGIAIILAATNGGGCGGAVAGCGAAKPVYERP